MRGTRGNAGFRHLEPVPASPHPSPLPEGEGDRAAEGDIPPPGATAGLSSSARNTAGQASSGTPRAKRRFARRRGLAPLEMALALPILLFVMALIVDFGTAACLEGPHVERRPGRTLANALAADADRAIRNRPIGRSRRAATTDDLGSEGNLNDSRVEQNQPVVPGIPINSWVLDQTQGFREGKAGITKAWPFLPKLLPMHLDAKTQMLDNRWQFQQMGMWSNDQRRIPILYVLPKAPDSMAQAYVQAIVALWQFQSRHARRRWRR